eukprot:TRINITY_DN22415_c0_g1_i1.p1 TRINITY_DN22415_c0_g1~~TRINITY_DN22415_c0_g1_i1.p1  ORF type:complete len:282 (-),score=26.36 TRINITY_DN22415_c0_g1_i1:20-865(-)
MKSSARPFIPSSRIPTKTSSSPSSRRKGCDDPCLDRACYNCSPQAPHYNTELKRVLYHAGWATKSREQDRLLIPFQHFNEFHLMEQDPQSFKSFWGEAKETFLFLIKELNAQGPFRLEINYGSYITHKANCPNYHAHCHVTWANYAETMCCGHLKNACPRNCRGQKKRNDYPEDHSEEINIRINLFEHAENIESNIKLLSTIQEKAIGEAGVKGFVLRIIMNDLTGPSQFYMRAGADQKANMEKAAILIANHFHDHLQNAVEKQDPDVQQIEQDLSGLNVA